MKCVIVGDSDYAKEYVASLKAAAPEDVVFTGYVFGDGYRELSANAYCFVETSEVGGTHPALLEAMGFGTCVVANDIPENMEIIDHIGFGYSGKVGAASLRDTLQHLISQPELVAERRRMSLSYVREKYSWELVTEQYLALIHSVKVKRTSRKTIKAGTSLDSE